MKIFLPIQSSTIISSARDEKVGNFPVRMLVILVKLAKLIELKRGFVKQLTDLNDEAEKTNLFSNSYPATFQVSTNFLFFLGLRDGKNLKFLI